MRRPSRQFEPLTPRLPLDATAQAAFTTQELTVDYGQTAYVHGNLDPPQNARYYKLDLVEPARVTINAKWQDLDDQRCRIELFSRPENGESWKLLRRRWAANHAERGCQPSLDGLLLSGNYLVGVQGAVVAGTPDLPPATNGPSNGPDNVPGGDHPTPTDVDAMYSANIRVRAAKNVVYEPIDGGYVLNFDAAPAYSGSSGVYRGNVTGAIVQREPHPDAGATEEITFTPAPTFFIPDTTSLVLLDGVPFDVRPDATGALVARRSSLAGNLAGPNPIVPLPTRSARTSTMPEPTLDRGLTDAALVDGATVVAPSRPRFTEPRPLASTQAARGEQAFVGVLELGMRAVWGAVDECLAAATDASSEAVAAEIHCALGWPRPAADQLFHAIEEGVWSLLPGKPLVEVVRRLLTGSEGKNPRAGGRGSEAGVRSQETSAEEHAPAEIPPATGKSVRRAAVSQWILPIAAIPWIAASSVRTPRYQRRASSRNGS